MIRILLFICILGLSKLPGQSFDIRLLPLQLEYRSMEDVRFKVEIINLTGEELWMPSFYCNPDHVKVYSLDPEIVAEVCYAFGPGEYLVLDPCEELSVPMNVRFRHDNQMDKMFSVVVNVMWDNMQTIDTVVLISRTMVKQDAHVYNEYLDVLNGAESVKYGLMKSFFRRHPNSFYGDELVRRVGLKFINSKNPEDEVRYMYNIASRYLSEFEIERLFLSWAKYLESENVEVAAKCMKYAGNSNYAEFLRKRIDRGLIYERRK